MRRWLAVVFCAMGGLAAGLAVAAEPDGKTTLPRTPDGHVSLAGTWQVWPDPDDVGVAERWFGRGFSGRLRFPAQLKLPGSLASNGLGNEVSVDTEWTGQIVDRSWYDDPKYAKYRQPGNVKVPFWLTPVKHYVGAAWYARMIDVPKAWHQKRVILFLERVHWESRVWVDGHEIGTQNSLSTPHEYDLGVLTPGKHRLKIRVDNRVKIAVGINAHSVTDHTQTNWNGIVGRIELSARDAVWIDDVQVFPDIKRKVAKVRVTVGSVVGKPVDGTLTITAESANRPRWVLPREKRASWAIDNNPVVVEVDYPLDAIRLWDEFQPKIDKVIRPAETCMATVSLEGDVDGHSVSDRSGVSFGLRDFKVDGTRFTCNGRPVFLRGTLECGIFPLTGYPPTDLSSWMRILRVAKAHGLNHLRFHSWCPPQAAFEAADRLGFIFQVESAVWTKVGVDPVTDRFIYDETERILRCYGNHPSFCLFSHGNEPGGRREEFLAKWVDHFKKKDPRRLYTSGSGWPIIDENEFHVTARPRIQAWGGGLKSRVNAKPPETVTDYRDFVQKYPQTPVVSHEIGQWCVYPNFDEIKKYTGVTRAYNFEIFRDTLRANHMADQSHDFLMASGKLQAMLYKEEIESALRTPGFGGFQLLDLHDFPGQGTALVGVLDPFWDSKGYITAPEFRRFCCETVPLARMEKRTWTTGETFAADVEIAHFGPAAIKDAEPVWSIVDAEGKAVASGKLSAETIPVGNAIALGRVTLPLKKVAAPQKLILTVALDGTNFANDWDFWVYPEKADTAVPDDILVVDSLNDRTTAALEAGGRVLLLPAPGSVRGDKYGRVPPGFSSIFWNTAWTRRQAPHTLGILCNPKHPALERFPTDFHSNWQWWELVATSQIMILDRLPPRLRPIVQVIDDWFTNRRLGLVFEARVGKGSLLVCGIDLQRDLGTRPVARQMRHSLLRYMSSPAFRPTVTVDGATIRGLLAPPPTMQRLGARVLRADSESVGYEAFRAIDGDRSTCWHTAWEKTAPAPPHELVIDLGKTVALRGFHYLPRQDLPNGWIGRYAFYVSSRVSDWGQPAAAGKFAQDRNEKVVRFKRSHDGRYVRLVALEGFGGNPWTAVAEIDVLLEPAP